MLGTDSHKKQNANIRLLEARCKELQRMCGNYQEILEKDVGLFTKSTIEDLKD